MTKHFIEITFSDAVQHKRVGGWQFQILELWK